MSPEEIERQQIEIVFALGGGELDDRPWGNFAYSYDGIPEYMHAGDLDNVEPYATATAPGESDCRTVIACGIFGAPKPPVGWRIVGSYVSSGEAQCWCVDCDREGADPNCEACEGEGLVYIGDGYAEWIMAPIVVPVDIGSGATEGIDWCAERYESARLLRWGGYSVDTNDDRPYGERYVSFQAPSMVAALVATSDDGGAVGTIPCLGVEVTQTLWLALDRAIGAEAWSAAVVGAMAYASENPEGHTPESFALTITE